MDQVDDGLQDAGVAVLVDAVAEIEDVARMAAVVGEDRFGAGHGGFGAGEHQRRIEVALYDEVVAETSSRASVIVVRQSSPSTRLPTEFIDSSRWSQPMPKWMPGHVRVTSASSAKTRCEWGSTKCS